MPASLSEFAVIAAYFSQVGVAVSECVMGVGDDCAVIDCPPGMSLACSIDTMVEGVHFPQGYAPDHLASRVFGAAFSDLAAMGARPSHFSLALTLPEADTDWLSGFAQRLSLLAARYSVQLVGGDTTRGPLSITLQVHGWVEKSKILTRAGAEPGDLLCLSGEIGDAGAALRYLACSASDGVGSDLLQAYHQPEPRIDLGLALAGLATSCIDVSDGLVADAAHIAAASGCALHIELDHVPVSAALVEELGEDAKSFAIEAGDDYELLFSISSDKLAQLTARESSLPIHVIGAVAQGSGVHIARGGRAIATPQGGYRHFSSAP